MGFGNYVCRNAKRITGKTGKTDLAYLIAYDEHSPTIIPFEEESEVIEGEKSFSNIFRIRHAFEQNSYIGAIATDRRMEGDGAGTVFGADGSYRFWKYYRFELQALASRTKEPNDSALSEDFNGKLFDNDKYTTDYDGERYWGRAFYASLERLSENWNFDIDLWETSPTFRADNGFITGNSTRQISGWTGWKFYPNSSVIDQLVPNIWAGKIWNFSGICKDEWYGGNVWANLKDQIFVNIEFITSDEKYSGIQFEGKNRVSMEISSEFSEPLTLGFWWQYGRNVAYNEDPPVMGIGYQFNIWATIKPLSRLIIQPSSSYQKLNHTDDNSVIFDGYILRIRTNLQFTRELFLRLIFQYDDFDREYDIEPLLTCRINPFTLFYIGSRHDYKEYEKRSGLKQIDRQFFLKFQYLFRM